MKKIVSILLIIGMLLSLAACGAVGKPAETAPTPAPEAAGPVSGEQNAPADEGNASFSKKGSAPAQATAAPPEETPVPAEESAAPDEELIDAEDMLGESSGNRYANEMLGIQATLPDDWMILSKEQTAQVMGSIAENFTNEDFADQLRQVGSLCDLYAVALDISGDNMYIMLLDLGVAYGIVLDEGRFLDLMVQSSRQELSAAGIEVLEAEKEPYEFAGREAMSLRLMGAMGETSFYERIIPVKAGQYMGMIVSASAQESRVDRILGCFEPYGVS